MSLPKTYKTMMNYGITIGNMKKILFLGIVAVLFLGSCEICNPDKVSDAVMPKFTTKLTSDTFEVGQPIPFYLQSNQWVSLYDGQKLFTANPANLSFGLIINGITDSGRVNVGYLMSVTSDMAAIVPETSNVDLKVHGFTLYMDLDGDAYLSNPAFWVTPLDTGRFSLSFELGALATIVNEKKGKCDRLMEMYGSFTENEYPNPILDDAGMNYQTTVVLPGGTPQLAVSIYGFYVKP